MIGPALSPAQAQLAHLLLEWAGIAAGVQLYRLQRRRAATGGLLDAGAYAVVMGCILGAAIGNKIVFWLEYPHLWAQAAGNASVWMSGSSIVGGLLGGLLGVELAKKLSGQTRSTGDQFVLPLIAGIAIGRIGCFLAGLQDGTYGLPTTLPWGVDFGDGVARHPTQLYDLLFVVGWGALLLASRERWRRHEGLMFKLFLAGYLAWRAGIDALKPLHYDYGAGLGGVQLVCLVALLFYLPLLLRQLASPLERVPP